MWGFITLNLTDPAGIHSLYEKREEKKKSCLPHESSAGFTVIICTSLGKIPMFGVRLVEDVSQRETEHAKFSLIGRINPLSHLLWRVGPYITPTHNPERRCLICERRPCPDLIHSVHFFHFLHAEYVHSGVCGKLKKRAKAFLLI